MKKIIKYLIDIFIILVIVAVGIYGYGKITANYSTQKASSEKTVYVTVEFDKNDKEVLSKVKQDDVLYDGNKNSILGTVTYVSDIFKSKVQTKDYTNGKIVNAETDEYGLMHIILECKANVSPMEIKVGSSDIKVGTALNLRTDSYALSGKVMGIEIQE